MAEHACRTCLVAFVNAYPLNEEQICANCRGRDVSFDAAYSYGDYEGALRDLIRLFKYAKIETLARPFGKFMLQAVPRDRGFDLLMPMPIHWYRRWQRGFNQAELLSKPVARMYGLSVSNNLRRVRLGRTQAGLGATARRQNLLHAFEVRRPAEVNGKRILLIDDVLTTGTTLAAASACLKAAGAKHVTALTLARVPRRGGLQGIGEARKGRTAQDSTAVAEEWQGGSSQDGDGGTAS